MSNQVTIALDIACDLAMTDADGNYVREYDEALHKSMVDELAAKHGVTAVMVDPEGPGGGHPIYELTGTREALEAYIATEYDPDANEDMDFYFE
jgi:hypothetical protein